MAIIRSITQPITAPLLSGLGSATIAKPLPPSGLPTLPITLVARGSGPLGVVISPTDAITAALAYNAAIANAGVYYVKPSTGSDSNAGTIGAPFATVAKAMRTATGAASRVVMLEDCVIPTFDLRATDASQTTQQFKWLDANGYNVIIRDSGPDPTTQTWVQDGTNTNCYTTTLAVSGSQQPTRVLRTDQTDAYGYSQQLKKYTSAALLNAGSGDGWYWDNTGKVLWVKLGAGTNVESQKSILKCLYLNSSGTSRVLAYGASLGLSGVRLEGAQVSTLDLNSRRPELWLHNCVQLWANNKGFDGTQTGWFIATNHLCYASQSDGANGFAKSATGKGLMLTANSQFINSGDQSVFPADGTLQGESAHGGVHHCAWGNKYIGSNAPGVQDTCNNSENDISWLVSCYASGYSGGYSTYNYAFGSTATSASRKAYLDSCQSASPTIGTDLRIDVNATVYAYNCPFTVSGGSVIYYGPSAPP